MPQAEYELGITLDSPIDEVVENLKAQGWNAQKGVRYGIPYLRIRRTGFHHVVEYESWGMFVPNIANIPTDFLPKSRKYWCWSALEDQDNPNTTGFLQYNNEDYYYKLRGVINSLGTDFSKIEFLEAVYMMLWDPCKIPNSFTNLKPKIKPATICPVCTPPKVFKKIIKDGTFPAEFTKNFLQVDNDKRIKKLKSRFQSYSNESTLTSPIPLAKLNDRFQTEKNERIERRDKVLAAQPASNIPEHFLFRRKDHLELVRTRTWLIHDSDPGVAHLGFDINLGELPISNIPAIQTRCKEVWLTLPEVLDGDFGKNKPCFSCFANSFYGSKETETGRRLTDISWAETSNVAKGKPGNYTFLGWGQPVITPKNLTNKREWYLNSIDSFGIFTLLLTEKLNKSFNLKDEVTDRELVRTLLKLNHPESFICKLCDKKEFLTDLTEEFCTPASTSKYRFLISIGSVVRLGPTTLCGNCRANTYGTDYPDLSDSEEVLDTLVDYKELTGVIPDRDWRTRPLLRHITNPLSTEETYKALNQAIKVTLAMPSGFKKYLSGPKKIESWKEDQFNWWEILYRAGLVEKFKETARGKQGISEDGHLCLSMLEWKFCNLLFHNGIEHTKEPRYTTLNQTRADYLIGDLYIEIAGLLGDPDYEAKLKFKLAAAKERRQRVLVFSPKEIEDVIKISNFNLDKLEELWTDDLDKEGLSSLAHH